MRATSIPLLLASLLVPAALAQQVPPDTHMGEGLRPALDHYDPVLLNEYAAESIRRGDVETAWILLERAARLAPHDARILGNLRQVRAHRAGQPAPAEAAAPPARQAPAQGVAPEPPPLWPPK